MLDLKDDDMSEFLDGKTFDQLSKFDQSYVKAVSLTVRGAAAWPGKRKDGKPEELGAIDAEVQVGCGEAAKERDSRMQAWPSAKVKGRPRAGSHHPGKRQPGLRLVRACVSGCSCGCARPLSGTSTVWPFNCLALQKVLPWSAAPAWALVLGGCRSGRC